jgi:hypothetical protein
MAIWRRVNVRRVAEDVVFFGATVVLAWWAIDHDPLWLMALCVCGTVVAAVIARRALVWIRARHDRDGRS